MAKLFGQFRFLAGALAFALLVAMALPVLTGAAVGLKLTPVSQRLRFRPASEL